MKRPAGRGLFEELKPTTKATPAALVVENVRAPARYDAAEMTPIYVLTKEWVSYAWLCDAHKAAREALGWSCKEIGLRPGSLAPHPCQDCSAARRPI